MGFMQGSEISQNTRKMFDIIQFAKEKQFKAIIVTLNLKSISIK